MPSFHYNLWEQEAEHGRLAQPPPVLSNWGYMGQFESTPAPADEKRMCVKLGAFTDAWKLLTIVVWSGNFSLQSCNIKNLQNRVR